MKPEALLISVIIPCYNQARFLGQAIHSALDQTYPHLEVIVVDDGSQDDTAQVAASYPEVNYIRQDNRGPAAARNRGLDESAGEYVVFLDADDRLVNDAVSTGASYLDANPHCAFVSGQYDLISADGSRIAFTRRPMVERDHYLALLRGNYIGMHASVMYRRSAIETVGGFEVGRKTCEDYELYLRIARRFPVTSHPKVVAEYRQHQANMSRNYRLIMADSLCVLRSQWQFVKRNEREREAYRYGMRHWQRYCANGLIKQAHACVEAGDRRHAICALLTLLRYSPRELAIRVAQKVKRKIKSWPKLFTARATGRLI